MSVADPAAIRAATVRRATSALDWIEAAGLLHDYLGWMRAAAGFEPLEVQPALAAELADLASHYSGDDAVLFLAAEGGTTVGTIAVRFHHDGTAELKRMYVRPVARGHGLADRLVGAVVDAATARGCRLVWLETQRGAMDRAIAAYRHAGFVETGDLDPTLAFDGLVVMRRDLAPAAGRGRA
jgi:GNAT superfamily N-acetyltransferase